VTHALATRPTPLSRVWSGTKVIADDVEGDDLADVLELHADASAWWVMSRSYQEAGAELQHAAKHLGLDDLAVRDLLAEDRRAKFEDLGRSRMVVTNAVRLDRDSAELTEQPVSMVVTNRALICMVDRVAGGVDPAHLLTVKSEQLSGGGPEHALQFVVGAVIESYEEVVEWLEDRSDELSDALFAEQPLSKEQQIQAFRLRTVLSRLRRLTDPMRKVIDDIVSSQPPDDQSTRRWALLQEHHHRVANAADALRETMSSVFDTSLALADLRMNKVMKQLTGWAAIIAVPTLITGFAGMNVSYPLDGTTAGFWVYSVIMLVSVVALYVVFRRKEWI